MNGTKPISSKLKNQGIFPTDSDNSRSFFFIMIKREKKSNNQSFHDENRIQIYFVCIACRHYTIEIKNPWTIHEFVIDL